MDLPASTYPASDVRARPVEDRADVAVRAGGKVALQRRIARWVNGVAGARRWHRLGVLGLAAAAIVWGGLAIRGAYLHGHDESLRRTYSITSAAAQTVVAPNDARAHLGLGYAYIGSGMPRPALAEYNRVLKRNREDPAALYGRGMALLALGEEQDGVVSLWRVVDRDPGHVRASVALGEHYARHRQYRSLLVAVEPAAKMHPDDAALQSLMGLAYERLGRVEWSTQRYELALKADPGFAAALEGLKRLHASR